MTKKLLTVALLVILTAAIVLVVAYNTRSNSDSATVATAAPTEQATAEVTDEPTAEPTDEPTDEPTAEPTDEPTAEPTDEPTAEPTDEPTAEPTDEPTPEPTDEPTAEPTDEPTPEPTDEPTAEAAAQTAAVPAVVAATATAKADAVDDFTVTLVTGETFTLSDYRGKIVVVDLWATWCPPCVASMPYLQQLSEEYAGQVVILGVNCGDTADTVAGFVEKYGYTFPIAVDENLDILYNHFYSSGIPYTVFIDANGELYDTHLGGGDDVYDELKEMIDGALAKTPVETE